MNKLKTIFNKFVYGSRAMSEEISESRQKALDEIERSNFDVMEDINWIIKELEKNIKICQEEYKQVSKMSAPIGRRMQMGIMRNIRDRKEDLDDYKRVLHQYKTRNKAHRD